MELNSQKVRQLAPENDPLKIGMGWTVADLDKPQILVESTFGDSHPGSAHLDQFVAEAVSGISEAGGKAARYFVTDICDGIAQGHDGINYSLVSRDMIANMIEIHGNSTGFDGGVFIASCDKSVPACLMGLCRLNLPSIMITGGVMDAGPDLLTLEQIGAYSAMCQRGEISEEQLLFYKHHACPSCGACSFMGTASTMQIMAETLGLMLPGSALMPSRSHQWFYQLVTPYPSHRPRVGYRNRQRYFRPYASWCPLPIGHPSCWPLACSVLLLCWWRTSCDGRNQVDASSGCTYRYRQDLG